MLSIYFKNYFPTSLHSLSLSYRKPDIWPYSCSSCLNTGISALPLSVSVYSICSGFCLMVVFSSSPSSSSSRSACATLCLLAPSISRSSALKRNGPATASLNIWGFHLPDSDLSNCCAGHSLSFAILLLVVTFLRPLVTH